MTTTTKPRHGGLDWNVPRDGRASDAYEVACTTLVLVNASIASGASAPGYAPARHATRLHVISGLLHKLAERACNEDLTCPDCRGDGVLDVLNEDETSDCRACAGTGLATGRKLESLRADAREIASHYGLSCYFQTDPRGCSLYIIDPGVVPANIRAYSLFQAPVYAKFTDEELRREWIGANYNRGHAVTRLGR